MDRQRLKRGCGVLYIAYGEPYVELAQASAASLRSLCSLPIHVISNIQGVELRNGWQKGITFTHLDQPDELNRDAKTKAAIYTPFGRTLMVDADCFFTQDKFLLPLKYLTRWDLVLLPHNKVEKFADQHDWKMLIRDYLQCGDHPCYVGGVIYFSSNPNTSRFFSLWNTFWKKMGCGFDSAPLVAALWASDVRFWALTEAPWFGKGPDACIRHEHRLKLPGMPQVTKLQPHWDAASSSFKWAQRKPE